MQAEHLDDELLQRHYDGDLDRTEAARADEHLQTCDACASKLAALTHLATLLASDAEHAAANADFAGMFERIEQNIARDAGQNSGAKVVSLEARRNKRPMAVASTLLAGLAAAAAVVLMVYRPGGGNTIPDEPVAGGSPSGSAQTAPAPTAANAPGHSEVVQADFGSNAGTVFDISLADGSSTPVVWINDDE